MKKLKLTTKQGDRAMSRLVRERDPYCFFCRQRPSIQNSHFWGRGNSATRYDFENCDGVCGGCHMDNEGSKQGHYRDLKIKQLGKEKYDSLERRGRSVMKREIALKTFQNYLEANYQERLKALIK